LLLLSANFSDHPVTPPAKAKDGRLLYASADPGAPNSASFFLLAPAAA
jgi:hypothetical protein